MDTSQYLSMFLEESMDNLQTLNESLLILEQEPNDKEILDQIFRVAHTIKGMAATMGYSTMAELTHKMEDVLSKFREGELSVTPKVVTVLFKCLDTLENMVNTISDGDELDMDVSEIVEHLEGISQGEIVEDDDNFEDEEEIISSETEEDIINTNIVNFNEYDLNVIKQAEDSGFNAFNIHIKLDEGTILKSARTFIIVQKLEEYGEIIKAYPTLEDLENENFDLDINFAYITKEGKEKIQKSLEDISEVKNVEVFEIAKSKANLVSQNCNLNEYDLDVIKQARQNGYNPYNINIELDEGTLLKSARVFIIMQKLEEHGEILKSNPILEDLENENFDLDINFIYLSQKNSEEIEEVIKSISEISLVSVTEIDEKSASDKSNKSEVKENANNKEESKKEEIKPKEIKSKSSEKSKTDKKKAKTNEKSSSEKHPKGRTVGQSVRVDLERLDKFMNMVSELVIHRTRLEQISSNHKIPELNETLEQVARSTSDLQDLVMKIRMLSLDTVFNRFPRMIRDLSIELGKEFDFEIQGQDTELDRTVIEEIGEPLIHLLRNAADHGIESPEERIKQGKDPRGKIKLIAYSEGTKAVIKVEDDGAGLKVDKIKAKAERIGINTEGMTESDIKNLIFSQGFSTNEVVTDVSGRGVGMDVVKTKISTLGGSVEAISEEGKGTSFIIRLPLTLQIIQALLVKVGTETMAISLGYIDRVIEYKKEMTKKTNNKEVIIYNDNIINLIRVNEKLYLDEVDHGKKYVVIAKIGEKEVGLLVDSLLGQQEIVIKSFGKTLKNTDEYIGATILGDGLVTLILDVAALI